MIENHPFAPFIPKDSRYLLMGSFPGKESTQQKRDDYWYYGAPRNQFWKILEGVYDLELKTRRQKEELFGKLKIAVTDTLLSCERRENKNVDSNLFNKTYNTETVERLLQNHPVKKIFFTGKGVFREFKRHFTYPANIELIILPSPSPAFRMMKLEEKTRLYKQLLPDL